MILSYVCVRERGDVCVGDIDNTIIYIDRTRVCVCQHVSVCEKGNVCTGVYEQYYHIN